MVKRFFPLTYLYMSQCSSWTNGEFFLPFALIMSWVWTNSKIFFIRSSGPTKQTEQSRGSATCYNGIHPVVREVWKMIFWSLPRPIGSNCCYLLPCQDLEVMGHVTTLPCSPSTAVSREAWATLPESSSRPLPATLAQSRNLAHASLKTAVRRYET